MSFRLNFDESLSWPATPREHARRLWDFYETLNSNKIDFDNACEVAPYDREIYDELWEQASVDGFVESLSQPRQAAIARALVRKRPRKGPASTARRDMRLRAIAALLRHHFGLHNTKTPSSTAISVSEVLASLPGMPDKKSIEGVLTRAQK